MSESFPPTLRHQKREIHTVFRRFRYLDWSKNLSLTALADLIRASLAKNFNVKCSGYQKGLVVCDCRQQARSRCLNSAVGAVGQIFDEFPLEVFHGMEFRQIERLALKEPLNKSSATVSGMSGEDLLGRGWLGAKSSPKVLLCIYFLVNATLDRRNSSETW